MVTPVVADQLFWAYRVGAIGVGPTFTTTAHQLTAEKLISMIREATGERVRAKAAVVGAIVREEQGGSISSSERNIYGCGIEKAFVYIVRPI